MLSVVDAFRFKNLLNKNQIPSFIDELISNMDLSQMIETDDNHLINVFTVKSKVHLFTVIKSMIEDNINVDNINQLSDVFISKYVENYFYNNEADSEYILLEPIRNKLMEYYDNEHNIHSRHYNEEIIQAVSTLYLKYINATCQDEIVDIEWEAQSF